MESKIKPLGARHENNLTKIAREHNIMYTDIIHGRIYQRFMTKIKRNNIVIKKSYQTKLIKTKRRCQRILGKTEAVQITVTINYQAYKRNQ